MVAPIKTDIAVVGAGIIGLATAFRLAAAGREVVVIDPNEPGSGASFGNAGTFAPYACAPVGNPDVLRNLPSLFFNSESPLAIRLAALPALVPWLSRFVRQSLPAAARRNGRALAGLLKEAMPAWRDLADQAQLSDLLRYEGCLYLYREKMPAKDAEWSARLRDEMGIRQHRLTAAEVAEMEPALPPMAGGLFFPDAAHVNDPAALTRRMAAKVESLGASFQRARVERLEPQSDGKIRLTCGDRFVDAHTVVLAAGAWSRSLAQQVGDKIPLDTERGYHVEFDMDVPLIKRPVSPLISASTSRRWSAGCGSREQSSLAVSPRRSIRRESPFSSGAHARYSPILDLCVGSGWAFARRCPILCRSSAAVVTAET